MMIMPNKSAVICQAILLGFSLIFLLVSMTCYYTYMANNSEIDNYIGYTIAKGGSIPNIPGGFASAISMLGFAIIEANKPLN
jgi:hypothetical protein